PKWIGHNSTYNEFLDEYISKFTPPLLSFDYYPIETINGDNVFQEDTFYKNLLMFANKSKQYNTPFWAYCLCLEHLSGVGGRYFPYPTEGMMRIEAFSALAFGAQGIVYWQYRSDDLNSETSSCQTSQSSPTLNEGTQIGGIDSIGSSTFMGADEKGVPVYGNGITTSVWQSIRNINADIIKENDKFFNCKFISHKLCFGNEEYSMNGEAGLGIIKSTGKGFLMTHIETPDSKEIDNNGQPVINKYIVIVSRDPFNSQELRWTKAQRNKSSIDKDICTPDFNLDDNNDSDQGNNNSNNEDINNASLWFKATLKPGGHYIFVC
ncbi:MAG: beta-galactosidase, partial [Lepagella sp.]